jgi:hypothetical protein
LVFMFRGCTMGLFMSHWRLCIALICTRSCQQHAGSFALPDPGPVFAYIHSYNCRFSPAHVMRSYSGSPAAICFTSPLSPAFARPFPLPVSPLLYLQPLSLLFPTLRSSALPGENTAASKRSYGPDWHCGTLLGHSHSWAKS